MNSDTYRRRYDKLDFAQQMRDNPTPAEDALWSKLRNKQIGHIFQRQILIRGYIVDFVQRRSKLVIELDGGIHKQTADYDYERTRVLERAGYRVLRFSNTEVLQQVDEVVDDILRWVENPKLPSWP